MTTDSIKDLLANKNFKEPKEIVYIKKFVKSKFGEEPRVKIATDSIIITVKGAAMAGVLRPEIHKIEQKLETNKKILIRIS